MSFGDPLRAEVATLGINPSRREFFSPGGVLLAGRERRLATAASLGVAPGQGLTADQARQVVADCNDYFDRNPYEWFSPLEALLNQRTPRMTAQPCIVALEGPCCAGKTTLGRLLVQELCELAVTFVPCYADHAGGGRFLPRQEADTVAQREQALRQLLLIEAGRLVQVPRGCDAVLEDRSVHTLLAHSYALQRKTGTDFLAPSARLLHSSPVPAWPDLVLYLDLPQDAVPERNPGKFPPGSIYTDPDFNAAVRAYFRRLAGQKTPQVTWLDATLELPELPELARLAAARIRHEIGQETLKGAI